MKYEFHGPESRLQIYVWLALLVFAICFVSGCSLTAPVAPETLRPPAPATLEHAAPAEVWMALARAVQAETIDSTTRLAQYVVVLTRNGELSQEDVARFDATFPQIATVSRPLSNDDINKLVELARKTTR